MYNADLEEAHLRRSLNDMLDQLRDRRLLMVSAVTWCMLHCPVLHPEIDVICRTAITQLLMDFVEGVDTREVTMVNLVDIIMNEMESAHMSRELGAASAALAARGYTVTPAWGINRFHLNGKGDYSYEDILDIASGEKHPE